MIVVIFSLLLAVYFGSIAFIVPLKSVKVIGIIIGLAVIGCLVGVGVGRIYEIKKENKDDYKKY